MGVFIALCLVLAVLPLGVSVRYNEKGPLVKIVAGPVKFTVFPLPKKKTKKPKKSDKQKKDDRQETTQTLPQPPQPPKQDAPKQEKGGSLLDFLPLVKLVFRFLGDFRRKLRLNQLQMKLILAGGDPCDLAVNYGRAWAAVGNLIPKLENWFVIKKRDIEVECDFTASETLVIAHLELTITLGRLLGLVVVYAIRALIEFLNIKKKRKGGAVT